MYVIAKYIRLSIEDAKSESMSIENQRLFLDSYITSMALPDATVLEFVDNGYSGTTYERPAVQELLELVRTGKANCIIVKDFSRFGRNAIEAGYFLHKVFPLYRTRFIAVSDAYDSQDHEGDTGGLEVTFKLLIHEQYSRDLSRKIKSARQEKIRRGESISKNCVYGYKKVGKHLEIDEVAAKTVRLIFSLSAEGKSLSQIVKRLYNDNCLTPAAYKKHKRPVAKGAEFDTVWDTSVISIILADEQYIGTYVAGKGEIIGVGSGVRKKKPENEWVRIANHHPAIISEEQFKSVQEIIRVKGEPIRKRKLGTSERYASVRKSPLKGKIACGCCGHMMTLSCTKNTVFRCMFTQPTPGVPCHGLRMLESELSHKLLNAIREQMPIFSTSATNSVPSVEYETLITSAQREKQTLYEHFVQGAISAEMYRTEKAAYDSEIERLNRVIAADRAKVNDAVTDRQLLELIETALRDGELTKPLVDALIDRVLIYPGERIEVRWKRPIVSAGLPA